MTTPFNLIEARWIPVRRQDGTRDLIPPWQITADHETNPVVALSALRADFDGALFQFLVGLLQTAFEPNTEQAWRAGWDQPPTPEKLHAAFSPIAGAFNLDGDGPRFEQDIAPLGEEWKEIAALLIEAPGGKTVRDNLDLFIKRERVTGLCPACAATALFTLQTNAPAGGVGHRTSLRGGGPLTTVVLTDPAWVRSTLWRDLWLNVFTGENLRNLYSGDPARTAPADSFPWLAPTRVSDKRGGPTTPEMVHPVQMYWAMPRRIRLDLDTPTHGRCDLCATPSERLVTRYTTRNYGINYEGPWRHPLSPYQRDKDGQFLPVHPQPGGITYRHFLGLVHMSHDGREPAKVVDTFLDHDLEGMECRLWAFGYDMDNMKARCWYESTLPLYHLPEGLRADIGEAVESMVGAAMQVASNLRGAVGAAWFERPGDRKGDTSFLNAAFWQGTEADFQTAVRNCRDALKAGSDQFAPRRTFHAALCRAALRLFDDYVLSASIGEQDPKRVALARNGLENFNRADKLLKTLGLPLPPRPDKKKSGSKERADV